MDHVVLDADLRFGRLRRGRGDLLCDPDRGSFGLGRRGSVRFRDGRAAAAMRALDRSAPQAADREFATPEGVRRAADLLQAAPRRGIHLPASGVERQPSLPRDAAAAGLRVALYGDLGDEHLARVVRGMRPGGQAAFRRSAFGQGAGLNPPNVFARLRPGL